MLANIKFARHLSSVAGIMSTEVIQGKTDRFKGITIKSTDHLSINGVDFGDKLKKSIEFWKGSSMRAAWFNIDLRLAVKTKYGKIIFLKNHKFLPGTPQIGFLR